MMMRLFSVYDSKANTYLPPFLLANDKLAIRAFAHAANDKATDIGKYPTDFCLFEIGTYDDQSGFVQAIEPFINHGLAATYIKE